MDFVTNGVDIFWIEIIIIQSMTYHSIDQIPLILTEQCAVDVSGEGVRHEVCSRNKGNVERIRWEV
jgi:hypothetical protein